MSNRSERQSKPASVIDSLISTQAIAPTPIAKTSRALELFQRRFEEAVGSVPNLLVHRLDASHDVSQWDTADQPTLKGHHVTEAALEYYRRIVPPRIPGA